LKTMTLDSPDLTVDKLLREAAEGDVVYLTSGGLPRFALVALDEGDQEVFALRSNAEFMAYLDQCKERARQGPRKTLQELRNLDADPETATDSGATQRPVSEQ